MQWYIRSIEKRQALYACCRTVAIPKGVPVSSSLYIVVDFCSNVHYLGLDEAGHTIALCCGEFEAGASFTPVPSNGANN